jgi:hypothetical protein
MKASSLRLFFIEDGRSHKWIAEGEGECRNLNTSSFIHLNLHFALFFQILKIELSLIPHGE